MHCAGPAGILGGRCRRRTWSWCVGRLRGVSRGATLIRASQVWHPDVEMDGERTCPDGEVVAATRECMRARQPAGRAQWDDMDHRVDRDRRRGGRPRRRRFRTKEAGKASGHGHWTSFTLSCTRSGTARSCDGRVLRPSRGPRSRGAAGVAERRDTGRAMSQENVEIVAVRHVAARTTAATSMAADRLYDPDVDVRTRCCCGTHRGNEAIRLIYERQRRRPCRGYDVDSGGTGSTPGDQVVAVAQVTGTARRGRWRWSDRRRGSPASVTIKNGRCVREQALPRPEEALEAAGLRE